MAAEAPDVAPPLEAGGALAHGWGARIRSHGAIAFARHGRMGTIAGSIRSRHLRRAAGDGRHVVACAPGTAHRGAAFEAGLAAFLAPLGTAIACGAHIRTRSTVANTAASRSTAGSTAAASIVTTT